MNTFDTPLNPEEEVAFQQWKAKFAPQDSGEDYDLRGAFKANLQSDAQTGHWPDTFKKPNHPTFSVESQYAGSGNPGTWTGPNHDQFVPGANMDFTQATGTPPQDPSAQQAPMGTFAGQQQQVPPEVMAMNKPATSPEELEVRKAGWLQIVQKVTSDPNLMRAIGMAGSTLMQPKDWGQTNAGHIGSAYQVGQSAYDFGKTAETEQHYAAAKENRAQESHVADVAQTQARTEETQVKTAGDRTANQIAEATKTETIAKAKLYNDNLDIQIKLAKTQRERDQLHLAKEQHLKEIFDQIPDATLRQQAIAEAEKQGAINLKNKAEAAHAGAQAGEASARAGKLKSETEAQRLENEGQATLTPAERAKQSTKSGRGTSAQVEMAEWFKANWKAANPKAAGEDDAKWEQRASQAAHDNIVGKKANMMDQYIKWEGTDLGVPGETPAQKFNRFLAIQHMVDEGKGLSTANSTPGGATTGVQKWGRDAKGNPVLIKEK